MSIRLPRQKKWSHPSIHALLESDGTTSDPEVVIRKRARALVAEWEAIWTGPPFDMEILASLCSYRPESVEFLADDQDACITLDKMLINARKPRVRQRYSIGHELGHTFFPDFAEAVVREGPYWRKRDNQSEVEQLCQIAASELLFPLKAFQEALCRTGVSIAAISTLSLDFDASFEATARRVVDVSGEPLVAVFLSMKHKPVEIAGLQQTMLDLPGLEPPEQKLRVSYAAASEACAHLFVPCDKSVPQSSVAQTVWREAEATGAGRDPVSASEDWTDVGGIGRCWVEAVALPLHASTPQSVFCLLRPEALI